MTARIITLRLKKKICDRQIEHAEKLMETLCGMQMTLLNTASGYIPSYTRTELTDALHKTFGFRTDYEFISKSSLRSIVKETKQIQQKTQ